MSVSLTALAGVAGLALIGTLGGCSSGHQVLARVGDRTITTADFMEVAQGAQAFYGNLPPDSAKARLLDDLVRRALLLEAAKRQGLDRDGSMRREVEDQVLTAALAERLAPRQVPVSDAEIRQLYEWRRTESHTQLIYAVERGRADAAMNELTRGQTFTAVADRFNLPGMLPPGGDLGYLAPGALVNPLDQYLREAPVGRAVGPVRAPGEGWFILRVVARRPRAPEPYGEARPTLAQMLRQRKQRALTVRSFTAMRDQYQVKVAPGGSEALHAYFNVPTGDTTVAEPTSKELATTLATYDDGKGRRAAYTLSDALGDLQTGTGERPNPAMLSSFRQWIESRVLRRIAPIEARRRHLHEEPAIAGRIENQVNEQLLEAIYATEIVAAATSSDEDVRQVYQLRSANFVRLDWVRLQYLTLPDSASAVHVLERSRQAPTLRDAILHSSAGMRVQEETVTFPATDPGWQALQRAFIQTSPRTYGGPAKVPNGWRVFQVLAKQQVVPPFESLDPVVKQNLTSMAGEMGRERRLKAYTDSLGKTLSVQTFPEHLKSIPWPVPSERAPAF